MRRFPPLMMIPVYLLGFLLLWEWFAPLSEITDTGGIGYFLAFTAFSLLINYLRMPWWLGMPLKAAFIMILLSLLFEDPGAGLFGWMSGFLTDFSYNAALLMDREWYALTDLFRSLLFLVIIWLMTYLLRYWLVIRKRIFIFYFMTVLYVAVLDTFTEYNAKTAIVRIVLIGFALLGILFFQRLLEKERLKARPALVAKWALILVTAVAGSAAIGLTAPKADPVWPDPVPFIQSKAEGIGGGSGVARIGYSWDDTKLGGPFLGDDRVVFEVKTPTRQYWRIETKDMYTGKGWVASDEEEPIPFDAGDILAQGKYDPETPEREAQFSIKIGYPHIIQPYGFLSVDGNARTTFAFEPGLNRIKTMNEHGEDAILKNYTVTYQQQEYSMKALRETKGLPVSAESSRIWERYTRLPDMPARVGQLARQITGEYDNWYDKAKAVERYLKSSNFTYDQTEVAVPKEGQDYVDQFLFETQIGYCDNFSTSMIALLRSVNIPARWAKGYTAGNYHGEAGANYRLFEVTNNEAHSWVEVYFPTEGWVPFEPTKGFTNFSSFRQDELSAASPAVPKRLESNEIKPKPQPEEGDKAQRNSSNQKKQDSASSFSFTFAGWLAAGALAAGAAIAAWLYFHREKWMPYFLLRKYKEKEDEENFVRAYGDLLKQLDRFGAKKEPGQTLREYASYIDGHFGTDEMSRLTSSYERLTYSGGRPEEDWHQMKQLWENLIKRTTG